MAKKMTKMDANTSGKLKVGLTHGSGKPAGKAQPKVKAAKK